MSSSVEDDPPEAIGSEAPGNGDAAAMHHQALTPAMHLIFNMDGVSEIRYLWQSSADGRSWGPTPDASKARLLSRQSGHSLSLTLALTSIFIDSPFSFDTAHAVMAPAPGKSGDSGQTGTYPHDMGWSYNHNSEQSTETACADASAAGGSTDNGGPLLEFSADIPIPHGSGVPLFLFAGGHALGSNGGLISVFVGEAGHIIRGGEGNDTLFGSDGDDTLFGGGGNDRLFGGLGNDIVHGGDGDDVVSGDQGDDVLAGNAGNDAVTGGDGADVASGDAGNDSVSGGGGDDIVSGDEGDDTVSGDEGDDTVSGGEGDDSVSGGEGDDTVSGGEGDDAVSGGEGDDTVSGGEGDDTVSGGTGNDTLYGGRGHDVFVYRYGDGNDAIMDFEDDDDELIFYSDAPGYQISNVDYGRDYTFTNGQVLAVHGNSGKGSKNSGSEKSGSDHSNSGSGGDHAYDDDFDYTDFGNHSAYDRIPGVDGEWADFVATGVIDAPNFDAQPVEDYASISDLYYDHGLYALLGVSTITFSHGDHNLFD